MENLLTSSEFGQAAIGILSVLIFLYILYRIILFVTDIIFGLGGSELWWRIRKYVAASAVVLLVGSVIFDFAL